MAQVEFRIGEWAYRARSLDAWTQLDILTMIGPLMAAGFVEFVSIIGYMKAEGIRSFEDLPQDRIVKVLPAVAEALAKMPKQEVRQIIATFMALCQRWRADDMAPKPADIWVAAAGRAISDDLNEDLSLILQIALNVFEGNFRRYFPESLFNLLDAVRGSNSTASK